MPNAKSHSAVYLVLRRDQRVLMMLRQNTGYMDGMWDLPAGHVEAGEPATLALAREAREEVGVEIAPAALRFLHVTHRNHGPLAYFGLYFEAGEWAGEPVIMEPEKCGALEWLSIDALPENTVPFTRDVLKRHWPGGAVYAEWGW